MLSVYSTQGVRGKGASVLLEFVLHWNLFFRNISGMAPNFFSPGRSVLS